MRIHDYFSWSTFYSDEKFLQNICNALLWPMFIFLHEVMIKNDEDGLMTILTMMTDDNVGNGGDDDDEDDDGEDDDWDDDRDGGDVLGKF